jgi:hypothetical protein
MLATLACTAVLRTSATCTCTCANFTNRVTCIILHFSVRRLLSTCAVLALAPARQFHKLSALYNATPTSTRPPTTGGQGAPWAPWLCASAVRQVQVWLAEVQERVQVGHGPQAGTRSVACVLFSFLHPLSPFQPSFLSSSFLPPLLPIQIASLTSSHHYNFVFQKHICHTACFFYLVHLTAVRMRCARGFQSCLQTSPPHLTAHSHPSFRRNPTTTTTCHNLHKIL